MKKLFKIIGISLLTVLILLIAAPFLFQNQIKESVKTFLNDSVNAQIDFEDVSLSLFSSFPQANVTVQNLKIVNQQTFEGETFAAVKSISFDMSVKELFKNESEGPIVVNSIQIDEAILTIKSDKYGNKNYDIAKETEDTSTESDTNFKLNIEDYALRNSSVTYIDETSNTVVNISALNHSGKGNFSTDLSELNTTTEALVSFSVDNTNYLNANSIKLDALIALDLVKNKYTFKENKFFINQLALEFDGFVKLLEDGSELDITFKNTGSTFKEFLAVIPETYSNDIEGVTTTGGFKIDGFVKGLVTETSIPKMDIKMVSNNASFKYPSLPKSVEDISINASIKNDSGNMDDTYVSIRDLQFRIDQDVFKSSATLKNLTKNMLVDATVDGTLNLANISKAYPVELDTELSGTLNAKLHTVFDMNAIETNAYERTQNNGTIAVSNFVFSSEELVNPIHISKVDVEFKPGLVMLQSFVATTGKSDLAATGTIYNLLGFLLSDKNLQGDFKLNSNIFAVSDFMAESNGESTETEPTESLKIPAFLECTLTADAKTVLYDNLTLEDVKGTVVLKDEKATLKDMSSRIFDGNLTINGTVDTQPDTPIFDLDLGVDRFDISQSFNSLELLQNIAPIAKALQGKLNSTFKISGDLSNDFTPDLNSITGDAFAELLTTKVEPKNAAVFNELEGALSFVDFDKLDLKDLKTKLDFKNGAVNVSPFDVSYEDITITVAGSHSFDKTMSYNAVFEVPAKYFGNEVNNLIASIGDAEAENLTVPVTATIGGSYTSPKVSTDLTSGVSSLTKQLIAIQKQKLINQGTDQIKDVLGGLLGGNSSKTDSTSTETKNPVKDILGSFLGGKKKD
ncbi:outer membrane assembly protein [Formosa sp. Hel1_33_131]|uniref:AsmA-like C-terminal region-containing protein n=1 Tax=Formosa sp. Hel1_33_131 TaxID=1336794 RepID=UPI00084E1E8D|nr:AsmA-like C-terminal region-containing protein [Formosa sp. Hel1_33_131]AOR27192.1 outer membrane assembly protein [Formosa sp. Hel1_33_131]